MTGTETVTLIVEDDPSTRELLVHALAKQGIKTVEAATVGQALVRLEEVPMPTSLVLDLMLPDAKGTVVLRRIRRNQLPIRVAVVTGAAEDDFTDLLRFPPDRLFRKPVDLPQLIAWLQEDA